MSDETKQSGKEEKRVILAFFIKLAAVCLALWIIFTFVFGIAQMKGETMYPRIRDGDLMLYYRLEGAYAVGDVVTFKIDDVRYTARVVAMDGDIVIITEDGKLMVNGNVQEEEIFYPTEEIPGGVSYPYIVEVDSYFVLCDFRTAGTDSRSFGAIERKDFDGKVITILRRRGI